MNEKHPLIGRGFHTQRDDFRTIWQGEVIASLGSDYFLVQLFEWFVGSNSTQHVISLTEFAEKHKNGVPKFRFFTDMKEANNYLDAYANPRDARIDGREQQLD